MVSRQSDSLLMLIRSPLVLFLIITIFGVSSAYTQDTCNVVFEDFESFDPTQGIVEQSNGQWIFFHPGAADGDFKIEPNFGQYLNINSIYSQQDDTVASQIIQVLDLVQPGILELSFYSYSECGGLIIEFLELFEDTSNMIRTASYEFDEGVLQMNDQVVMACDGVIWIGSITLRLNYITDSISWICEDGTVGITMPFINPTDHLYGIAWGSNQCAFIDNLCITQIPADADMDGYDESVDCDDSNPEINPGADEIPNNNVDENCDGIILIIDEDGDGFNSDEDCDDSNADINPEAEEIPNNDIDENCDGVALIIDEDGDGFNSDEDCDDSNADINPEAEEIPNNDIDENCDGVAVIIDEDGDGYNSDDDCDDSNADIYPGADEIPNNGIDEDCDGEDLVVSTILLSQAYFQVQPNPFRTTLKINFSQWNKFQISLFDQFGAEVFYRSYVGDGVTIDLAELSTGMYFLKLAKHDSGGFAIEKVIKF